MADGAEIASDRGSDATAGNEVILPPPARGHNPADTECPRGAVCCNMPFERRRRE